MEMPDTERLKPQTLTTGVETPWLARAEACSSVKSIPGPRIWTTKGAAVRCHKEHEKTLYSCRGKSDSELARWYRTL